MLRFVCYLLYKESVAGLPVKLALAAGRGRGNAPPLRGGGFLIALFSRWVAMHGRLQRAAYMPPLRTNPLYSLNIKSRAGLRILYAAALPCCYRRHNLPGITGDGVVIYSTIRGGGVVIGSTVWGLLFTAQFGFAARGLLFPTQFKTVVIHGTFPLFAQKIGLLSAAQLRLGLLFSAQFGRVVKHSTVAAACRLTAF